MNTHSIRGSGGGGCFAAGAQLSTPNGFLDVKDAKVGDVVLCFDQHGILHERPIEKVFVHEQEDVYDYLIWGDIYLPATPNHWVLNQYGTFAQIDTLTVQDCFIDQRGHLRPLLGRTNHRKCTVYNFHIKDYCTFIINGIRVHNGGIDLSLKGAGGGGGGKGGGGGGGGPSFREDPNTLQNNTMAYLLEAICCGPIVGLAEGEKSILIDYTPVQNPDGSKNYQGVQWYFRDGTMDQEIIPGFETIRSEESLQLELKHQYPITRRVSAPGASAVLVRISVPQFANQDTKNNALVGTSVSLQIDVSTAGGPYVKKATPTISGKTNSTYIKSYRIELEGNGPWDIRVSRLTADATVSTLYNKTYLDGLTILYGTKLSYPGVALMGYIVNSKEFGNNLPKRYVDMKGLIVDVPSNYDPTTRSYNGIWDGTFKKAWSDNPAWFLWWMLTDTDNGVGESIPEWALTFTKPELYELSKYCDELVDNGYGGLEPRFTFNAWMVDRQKAFDYIRLIAGSFRTQTFWGAGTVGFSQDRPRSVSREFTPANVIGGSFTYSETALSAKHSVAQVSWHDPSDFCRAAIEVVEDPELIQKLGYKVLDIQLLGCTSRGQARRAGAFAIYSEKYESAIVSFKIGLAECDLQPGEVIAIADPDYAGASFGGRVRSVDGTTVVLDRPIEFDESQVYKLCVTLPDATLETIDVVNPNTTTDTVSLSKSFKMTPIPGAIWILYSSNLEPRLFRVMGISEEGELEYGITAVQYDPRKYDAIEKGFVLPDAPTSLVSTGAIPAPTNLAIYEYLYLEDTVSKSACTLSWSPPDPMDARIAFYEVWIQTPIESMWKKLGLTSDVSIDVKDTIAGTYQFRVRSVSSMGIYSPWTSAEFELYGISALLPDVTGFMANKEGYYTILRWSAIRDWRDFEYELRIGDSWENGTFVGRTKRLVYPAEFNGRYWLKAVFEDAESTEPISVLVEDCEGVPASLKIAITDSEGIRITWKPVPEVEVKQYNISGDLEASFVGTEAVLKPYKKVGLLTFYVQAQDIAGYFSVNERALEIEVKAPKNPKLVAKPSPGGGAVRWQNCSTTWPVRDYTIIDMDMNEEVYVLNAEQLSIAPRMAGSYQFKAMATDIFENVSQVTDNEIVVTVPEDPVPVIAIDGADLLISWNSVVSFFLIDYYEVYTVNGVLVFKDKANQIRVPASGLGIKEFRVRAVDIAGNVSRWVNVSIEITAPQIPSINIALSELKDQSILTWKSGGSMLPIVAWDVIRVWDRDLGGGVIETLEEDFGRLDVDNLAVPPVEVGTHYYRVRAIDSAGNRSLWGETSLQCVPPGRVTFYGCSAIDNNFLLYWTVPDSIFFAISHYIFSEIDEDGYEIEIGTTDTLFTSAFESAAGTYTYGITPVDVAGNRGTRSNITMRIDQPSDFILYRDYDSLFNGEKTNMILDGRGSMLGPVLPDETWQQNIDRTSALMSIDANELTWNKKVGGGYNYYLSPFVQSGVYQEIVDVGTIVPSSKITVTMSRIVLQGVPSITCKIEASQNNQEWWELSDDSFEVYATAFRYVRYTFTITGGLLKITNINYNLNIKRKFDFGTVYCDKNDNGVDYPDNPDQIGTEVFFNVGFTDVNGIPQCTVVDNDPQNPYTAFTSFKDVLNPKSFRIFVLDKNGNRVSATVSWNAQGV